MLEKYSTTEKRINCVVQEARPLLLELESQVMEEFAESSRPAENTTSIFIVMGYLLQS